MNKTAWLNMGYKQLQSKKEEDIDTIFKKFDNGNIWIVQFNEDIQETEIGKIYLSKEQFEFIFGC